MKVLRYLSDDAMPEDVATIGYTWNESNGELSTPITPGIPNPYLDPLHPHARYAQSLLSFWSNMVQRDQTYSKRLQRHYLELRAACCQRSSNTGPHLLTKEERARRRKLKKIKRLRK